MNWTEAQTEELKSHWTRGFSASQIAAKLGDGVSRNAVCGKVWRLRLPNRLTYEELLRRDQQRAEARAKNGGIRYRTPSLAPSREYRPASTYSRGYRPRAVPVVDIPPPDTEHATLELRTGCAFPVNDGRPFLFCDAPTENMSPYCPHHRQRMYTKREKVE